MDKTKFIFYIGWLLCSYMGGATFPQRSEEIKPWLFRVGVVIAMGAIFLKCF